MQCSSLQDFRNRKLIIELVCRVSSSVTDAQRDPSLNAHHSMVTQAVMKIFEILGLKSVPFLESILPTVLIVVR